MKYNRLLATLFLLFFVIFYSSPIVGQEQNDDISLTVNSLTVSYNRQTRTFEVKDSNEGLLLSAGIIESGKGPDKVSTYDPSITPVTGQENEDELHVQFGQQMTVIIQMLGDSIIKFSTANTGSDSVYMTARAPLSERTVNCYLNNEKSSDNHTIVQTLGVLEVPGLNSIFDPVKDVAITIGPDGSASWNFFHQWRLEAAAKTGQTICNINVTRHYYRDRLGVTYYAPIIKRSYFQKAPALAMTWVGIEGKYNRPDFSQRKEWLYPNIDWVSQNLLPYAEEMIFQLDDNYPIDDPQYMRDISDYIRSKGLIPGIWVAPFGVVPYEETKVHPEWFISKPDGTPITTFSGLSYDDVSHYISAVLNVNNDQAVEKWFASFMREISEDWNYDYFKVDGIPAILNVYKQSVDGVGVEGVRRGLHILRSVVGPDKYLNTCWGVPVPLEGIDIVNGSRVGGDTEELNQVISRVSVPQNYLNNIAWYSDPDGAANMYASTAARARLNFQSRAILGQPYVTDDSWTKVPDHILHVWQKTLPTIESFPTNLYHISEPEEYDHFVLKIEKPWGKWDVISLNNYENSIRQMHLDLGRLPLATEDLYLFDFWNQKYLGTFNKNSIIVRNMERIDAHCFNAMPVKNDRPVLLSTNRHITQGGIDVDKMDLIKERDSWFMAAESKHLVKDDPYDLVFITNGYSIDQATTQNGTITILEDGGIARVRIIPDQSKINWNISFIPDNNLSVRFDAELVHLIPGQPVEVPIIVANGPSAHWQVQSSDNNILISEDHSRSVVTIDVSPEVLEPEGLWTGSLQLVSRDAEIHHGSLEIEVQGPALTNIAPAAKASASSVYFVGDQKGYGRADGANDMRAFRAWEAAEGETDGWVELIWEEPVQFQRLVIDEWMESGGEVMSWSLQAGHKKYEYTPRGESEPIVTYEPASETMSEIAHGKSLGRDLVIELDEAITANVLRLIIKKASERPGVWEIEVNPAF